MISSDEPQPRPEGNIPPQPHPQPQPQPRSLSQSHSNALPHPHSAYPTHSLPQGSRQPLPIPSVLQQPIPPPHLQNSVPHHPQPQQLYKGLSKPPDHPALNSWELPYVWAALTRFIPVVRDEILGGVIELEEALLAPPGQVHPTIHFILEHLIRIFKPKLSNVEPDALAKQVQAQLSDIKHWPEEIHDQPSASVVEYRPLRDGKSFWNADWREKVSVIRHLVDLSLSTPQVKDMIEKSYRVSTMERHRKRRDDPRENPLVLPPLGEDSKRQRLWVIDDKPRVYISGNPWKKTTTMIAVTDTMEDVAALANTYAMTSYQAELKAMEVAQHDKTAWKQLMNNAKKERDLAESLAGQRQDSFLRRCQMEEARVAQLKRKKEQEAEMRARLAQQEEDQKAMGARTRKKTQKTGYVEVPEEEDIEGEEEKEEDGEGADANEDSKSGQNVDDTSDTFKQEEAEPETYGRRSKRQSRNTSQTPSKQGTPSDKSTRSSSRLNNTNQDVKMQE